MSTREPFISIDVGDTSIILDVVISPSISSRIPCKRAGFVTRRERSCELMVKRAGESRASERALWEHRGVSASPAMDSPGMEFLVIGAQKAGTTTLWNLLRDHPQLWLPDAKEVPFFSHTEVYEAGWESYLERLRVPAGDGALRGTITPHYMPGWHDASTRVVAERIAGLLPEVRIVALLRDPVDRGRARAASGRAGAA